MVAIYPGSFDPITNGHLDVIERGSRMVESLVVAVLRNASKQPLFSVEERMEMLSDTVARMWCGSLLNDCWKFRLTYESVGIRP